MKLSPEESQEQYGVSAVSNAPEYPYGLTITLDEEAIEKLSLMALPQVGQTMMLMARVKVVSVSQRDTEQDGKDRSVSLQITDMELGADKKETDHSSALYG